MALWRVVYDPGAVHVLPHLLPPVFASDHLVPLYLLNFWTLAITHYWTGWCPWIYARSTPVLLFSRRRWQLVAVLADSGVGGMVCVDLHVLLLALGANTARSGLSPLA